MLSECLPPSGPNKLLHISNNLALQANLNKIIFFIHLILFKFRLYINYSNMNTRILTASKPQCCLHDLCANTANRLPLNHIFNERHENTCYSYCDL